MVFTKNHKYLQKVAISVQYGPDVMCRDKSSFAHCKLVVRNRFCGNKYYGRFCCRLDMIETYSFLTQSLLSNNPEKKKKNTYMFVGTWLTVTHLLSKSSTLPCLIFIFKILYWKWTNSRRSIVGLEWSQQQLYVTAFLKDDNKVGLKTFHY